MKKTIYTLSILSLFLFIFLYPSDSVAAAKSGLLLWFNVIIPNLLPFIILSNLIIVLNAASYITFLFAPLLKPLGISRDGCYAIITGFFCGYPMGAKVTSDLVSHNKISRAEGTYLLGFCNNVSPVFIINYIVSETFHQAGLIKPVFFILYLSPVLCALFFYPLYHRHRQPSYVHTAAPEAECAIDFKIVDTAIMNGFETITKLGGYIILFALLASMLIHFPIRSEALKYLVISLTEITNGVSLTAASSLPFAIKFILVLSTVSFGGLSCAAQTQSMLKNSGLSLKSYIFAKLINMAVTFLLCLAYLYS